MLKKHFLLVMLLVMVAIGASASTWKIHPYYVAEKIQNIFDTGDKVYYLNSGRLFEFTKATSTTIALNRQNKLSDNAIADIYYDYERNLLFVAYTNSNLDVIDGNGKVINISGLKDMVSIAHNYQIVNGGELGSHLGNPIKDINFGNGIAYVAVGYGYVTIDEETFKIIKNYDLGLTISVNSVTPMGDLLLILSNNRCYYGAPGDEDPLKNYQSATGSFSGCKMFPINDHSVFLYGTSNLYNYDFSSGTPSLSSLFSFSAASNGKVINVQRTPTGFIANIANVAACYTINAEGKVATQINSVLSGCSSNPNGNGTVWICDANGLHINGNTTYYKINSLTTDAPFWLKYNAGLNKLYVSLSAPNLISPNTTYTVSNVTNTYDGVNWANATAYSGSNTNSYAFVFDPLDPHTYVRASWNKGIYQVTDDVLKVNYTNSNAAIGRYKPIPAFDNYGNLWTVSSYGASYAGPNPTSVLTHDKLGSKVKTDWFIPSGMSKLVTGSFQRSQFMVSKKNNVKIFCDCDYPVDYNGMLLCWDNDNVDPTVDNYHLSVIGGFVDQNNGMVDWVGICRFKEDKDGMIWVGHTLGLFVFDPDVVFDESPRAIRPFASKFSEGKGYLCEGYSVYDIGVDRDNNKWIASNNGLYYVSPDGSEVYNHFTIENSDLPSDIVYSVECDTVNDRVYIATDNGFAEYVPHGDAAALNFDNVYAFPNPVEPDFTGMIKIAGLMDNSYVTITDRNGTVVAQFGPVMGSALWDGSGEDGERVPTGLYNIYAAQGAQPVTTGTPKATIMIIK